MKSSALPLCMQVVQKRLIELNAEIDALYAELNQMRSRQKIKCASCGKYHTIKDLDAIQTHWYTEPSGCTEGDYWNLGDLWFVCPVTRVCNRILLRNFDVPWEDRSKYEFNPTDQFRHMYKDVFKSVTDTHREHEHYKTVNNDYVDVHRAKFGLVEKRKANP